MPVFSFPDDPEWDEAAAAVVFRVAIGDYEGKVFASRRLLQALSGQAPSAEQAVRMVCLDRPSFERAAEMRLADRALDPDANIHLTARDLRRVAG